MAVAHAAGEEVYKTHCAACHDNPDISSAPSVATLNRLTPGQIVNTLMTGKMIPQAQALTSAEVTYVSDYLSKAQEADDSWMPAMMCPANRRTPKLNVAPTVSTFGFNQKNSRVLSYKQTGLKAEDFGKLDIAWVVGFPNVITMRSQGAVVGDTMFLPVGENKNRVYAFDISGATSPASSGSSKPAARSAPAPAMAFARTDGKSFWSATWAPSRT